MSQRVSSNQYARQLCSFQKKKERRLEGLGSNRQSNPKMNKKKNCRDESSVGYQGFSVVDFLFTPNTSHHVAPKTKDRTHRLVRPSVSASLGHRDAGISSPAAAFKMSTQICWGRNMLMQKKKDVQLFHHGNHRFPLVSCNFFPTNQPKHRYFGTITMSQCSHPGPRLPFLRSAIGTQE